MLASAAGLLRYKFEEIDQPSSVESGDFHTLNQTLPAHTLYEFI